MAFTKAAFMDAIDKPLGPDPISFMTQYDEEMRDDRQNYPVPGRKVIDQCCIEGDFFEIWYDGSRKFFVYCPRTRRSFEVGVTGLCLGLALKAGIDK